MENSEIIRLINKTIKFLKLKLIYDIKKIGKDTKLYKIISKNIRSTKLPELVKLSGLIRENFKMTEVFEFNGNDVNFRNKNNNFNRILRNSEYIKSAVDCKNTCLKIMKIPTESDLSKICATLAYKFIFDRLNSDQIQWFFFSKKEKYDDDLKYEICNILLNNYPAELLSFGSFFSDKFHEILIAKMLSINSSSDYRLQDFLVELSFPIHAFLTDKPEDRLPDQEYNGYRIIQKHPENLKQLVENAQKIVDADFIVDIFSVPYLREKSNNKLKI